VEAPVDVQTARVEEVLDRTGNPSVTVGITPGPDDRWLPLWTDLFQRGDPAVTEERVLHRIAPGDRFRVARTKRRARGTGIWRGGARVARDLLRGTVAGARRQGAATAVLHSLVRWASDLGATDCYLQVESGNAPAHRVYERLGFSTLYAYHYRTRGG
jgi:RimJ/RimL family protein N-acetyltransferase